MRVAESGASRYCNWSLGPSRLQDIGGHAAFAARSPETGRRAVRRRPCAERMHDKASPRPLLSADRFPLRARHARRIVVRDALADGTFAGVACRPGVRSGSTRGNRCACAATVDPHKDDSIAACRRSLWRVAVVRPSQSTKYKSILGTRAESRSRSRGLQEAVAPIVIVSTRRFCRGPNLLAYATKPRSRSCCTFSSPSMNYQGLRGVCRGN